MPTRKQRRRRAKDKRHEYEYVYVDEEGNEVEVPEEGRPSKNGKADAKQPIVRGNRRLDPPSWRKTMRRGMLFAPLMLVVVMLMSPAEVTLPQQITQTIVLLLFFLPFSYLMDSIVWRSYQRRLAKQKKG